MGATQANRSIRISTPLGEDVLLLTALSGREAMSQLFAFHLELATNDPDRVIFDKLVGKPVSIEIVNPDTPDTPRYIHGHVSRFSQSGTVGDLGNYTAEVVPWLWFLTRTSDCRIFQSKSVPDIVKQVFGEYGLKDFEFKLHGSYEPREYCVQYRETDFNFVSRLLEEEGIFYFFRHEEKRHVMIVANDPGEHKAAAPDGKARFYQETLGVDHADAVISFRKEQEVRATGHSAIDYNFERPSNLVKSSFGDVARYEIFDYPGSAMKEGELDRLMRVRQQEEDTPRIVNQGTSYCRGFAPGCRFNMTGEGAKTPFDGDYVLTAVRHHASETHDPEGSAGGTSYQNDCECTPAAIPYRPVRRTPEPVVNGVQTGVLVGPSGEEIHVDKYGRVKVQFHWDREGKHNESSSCWIRVSQAWAGKNWGFVALPRIGQEVIISFLEGDPDSPIITGPVYNAE